MSDLKKEYCHRFDMFLSDREVDYITDLVKMTGASKSEILRKALAIVWRYSFSSRNQIKRKITREIKRTGKIPDVTEILKEFEWEMVHRLNNMAYDECKKAVKSDGKKR